MIYYLIINFIAALVYARVGYYYIYQYRGKMTWQPPMIASLSLLAINLASLYIFLG